MMNDTIPEPSDDSELPTTVEMVDDVPVPRREESRGTVLWMLFVLIGPFGLPLLWESTRFSRGWKKVLTCLVVLQSLLVLWMLWQMIQWVFDSLSRVM